MSFLNEDVFSLTDDPQAFQDNYRSEIKCGPENLAIIYSFYYISHIKEKIRENELTKKNFSIEEKDLKNIPLDHSAKFVVKTMGKELKNIISELKEG